MSDVRQRSVEVRFLGDFSLTVDGILVERWRAGKARNLFQYLVLNNGNLVGRERLYEALWPHVEWSGGCSSLKVAAHAVRQLLDAHPNRSRDSGIRLVFRDFGYLIHIKDLWSDVAEFQRLVGEGLRLDRIEDTVGAGTHLRAALDLYRGEFLHGETADWAVEQRECLKSLALRALETLRDDALGRGDFVEVIEACQRALEIDPYHEGTYRALMTAHGQRGELDRVRTWYELCSRRLREEFAVSPSGQTEHTLRTLLPGIVRLRSASPGSRPSAGKVGASST